jgi:hypothetical protein
MSRAMATPPSRSPGGYPGIGTYVTIGQGWYEQQPPRDGASAGGEVLSTRWFEGETRKPSAANAAMRGVGASPSYPAALVAQPASQHCHGRTPRCWVERRSYPFPHFRAPSMPALDPDRAAAPWPARALNPPPDRRRGWSRCHYLEIGGEPRSFSVTALHHLACISSLHNLLINACCQCVQRPGCWHHPSGGDSGKCCHAGSRDRDAPVGKTGQE